MMTLQSSGAITLAQVQTEYGGSNPVSMSEYYRDGSYVDSTGAYTAYDYDRTGSDTTYWLFLDVPSGNDVYVYWNNSLVASFNGNSGTTNYTTGGYEYNRGTLQSTEGGGYAPTERYYQVRRRQTGINSSVPTSGAISMDDFYGGIG
tara:strand:- start:875 stop:1315 length:441 start_codon:yes stop_codon:yes gene_type:complete